MSPGAHLVFGWLVAASVLKERRERVLVSVSGLAPDVDGLGLLVDIFTVHTSYYLKYHHVWGHSIFLALGISLLGLLLAKTQRMLVFCLCFFVAHCHILFDIIGSGGPDGYQWPIHYLYPVFPDFTLTWSGQWALDSWQNAVIMLLMVVTCIYVAVRRKITVLEVFGDVFNSEVFKMVDRYIKK